MHHVGNIINTWSIEYSNSLYKLDWALRTQPKLDPGSVAVTKVQTDRETDKPQRTTSVHCDIIDIGVPLMTASVGNVTSSSSPSPTLFLSGSGFHLLSSSFLYVTSSASFIFFHLLLSMWHHHHLRPQLLPQNWSSVSEWVTEWVSELVSDMGRL